MPCYECQAWNSDYESCTLPGSQLEYACPHWKKVQTRTWILNEAKANGMLDLFKDLSTEQWSFMTELLIRFNERKML